MSSLREDSPDRDLLKGFSGGSKADCGADLLNNWSKG